MISIVIQNIIFGILAIGIWFIVRIFGEEVRGFKWVFASVLLLWAAWLIDVLFKFNFLSISVLLLGLGFGIYGLVLISKRKERELNVIDSIESAVNSMIKKIGAKGAVIFLEGIDKNLKFGTDKFDEGCLMLSIPIKLSDGTSCYITLYGDNPFAKFEQNDFETELAFLRLYLENLKIKSNALRLIHAEADEIPGLIVDKFDNYLVLQIRTAGIESFKHEITTVLTDLLKISGIYERSDMESRKEEGLETLSGELYGHVPRYVEIEENGLKFLVDLHYGQKTGFYLDQRDNRKKIKEMVNKGDKVLDLFCYSGAFSIYCASAGASVIGVDSDRSATDLARENAKINKLSDRITFLTGDAFETVESLANSGEKFDLIIIDPPAMTKTKRGAEGVKWAFHKLILNSLKMLEPGGKLMVSSCAYHVSLNMLKEAIRFASNDIGKKLRVIDVTFQPEDHPWILQMPETLYLKTIYLEVLK